MSARVFALVCVLFTCVAARAAEPTFRVRPVGLGGAAVATDGDGYLVVGAPCDGAVGLCARLLDSRGGVAEGAAVVISSSYQPWTSPAVTFADGLYFVVWTTTDEGVPAVRGARVSPDGEVLDPGGIALLVFPDGWSGACWLHSVGAAHDGERFVAIWSAEWYPDPYDASYLAPIENIWAARLTRDGVPYDAAPLRLVQKDLWSCDYLCYDGELSGASGTGGYLIAFEDRIGGAPALYAVEYLDASGPSERYLPIAGFGYSHRSDSNPVVGHDGAYLVFFWDFVQGHLPHHWGPPILSAWRPGTGETFRLRTFDSNFVSPLATVFDGRKHLVLWSEAGALHGMRVAPEGAALDVDGVILGVGAPGPIATNGRSFVVVRPEGCLFLTDDVTPPSLSVPPRVEAVATSTAGAAVTFEVSAYDDVSGLVPVTCDQATGATFAPGTHLVTCSAVDEAGNEASAAFEVQVRYAWSGVLPPVNADGSSVFKGGRTIPVKFRLVAASAPITNLAARITVRRITDGILGSVEEAIVSHASASAGDLFRFDPAESQYVFNLVLGAGTWMIGVEMGDGVSRGVRVSLRP